MKKKPKYIDKYLRDEINLGFKFTIIEAIRNVGKTTGALNFFKKEVFSKTINGEPHILVLFRNSAKELLGQLTEIALIMKWKVDKLAECVFDMNGKLRIRGLHFNSAVGQKSTIEVNNLANNRVCNWVWWDEYADINKFYPNLWHHFQRNLITIERENSNFRVLLTGNADVANNPILVEFGIEAFDVENHRIIETKEDIEGNDISKQKIMRFHRFLPEDFDIERQEKGIAHMLGLVSASSSLWNRGDYIKKNLYQIIPQKYFIKGGFVIDKVFLIMGSTFLYGTFEYNGKEVYGVMSGLGHEWDPTMIPLSFDSLSTMHSTESVKMHDKEMVNIVRDLAQKIKTNKLYCSSFDFMQHMAMYITRYGMYDEKNVVIG